MPSRFRELAPVHVDRRDSRGAGVVAGSEGSERVVVANLQLFPLDDPAEVSESRRSP